MSYAQTARILDAAFADFAQPKTPPPALTLAAVRKLGPCERSYLRVSAILPKRGKITARDAVEAGCNLDDLVWITSAVARNDKETERRLRHWLADCAARVLHIYERDYPNDVRVRGAIVAARQFADGQIGAAAWAAAWDAARAASWAAAWDAARDAARDAAWDAARNAAWAASWDAAWAAARDAARAAARAAAWDATKAAARAAARDAEEALQLERLVYWLTEAAPEPLTLPERAA
jgi:hypothetical protein